MSDRTLPPEECRAMEEVRAGIDTLDAEIIHLLARRFDYMRAAARIKPERGQVRDEHRKAKVIAAACTCAQREGVPVDVVADLWERLVEGSIAFELAEWDRIRNP